MDKQQCYKRVVNTSLLYSNNQQKEIMVQSIFTRPVFINPIGYAVIPELALISKAHEYDFVDPDYIFQAITKGLIEIKFIESGSDYIMHIDLYDDLGYGVLGEFYIDGQYIPSIDNITITQDNGFVGINFGYTAPILLENDDCLLLESSECLRLEDATI